MRRESGEDYSPFLPRRHRGTGWWSFPKDSAVKDGGCDSPRTEDSVKWRERATLCFD